MTLDMISAIVLAAGQSRRMGRPKMILPWGENTVIGQVVATLTASELDEILVVTGGARPQVEAALAGVTVRFAHNPNYAQGEMVASLQVGLTALEEAVEAALVVLGDQPQIELEVVRKVLSAYRSSRAPLVAPSYEMRRGHPWIIARRLWGQVMTLRSPDTLRSLFQENADSVHYVSVDSPSILQDVDTPEDYHRHHPKQVQ